MELSEKLRILRTKKQLSREDLAEMFDVSVQAITKWENGTSVPSTEKIVQLSNIFGISTDVLLKEELFIGEPKHSSCSAGCVVKRDAPAQYEGILIKESLENDSIIDLLNIHKVELWKTDSLPKYWTAITFTSNHMTLADELSKAIIKPQKGEKVWFADFKSQNIKYIVFRDEVLSYHIGNSQEKKLVCNRCNELGIPEHEMNWGE